MWSDSEPKGKSVENTAENGMTLGPATTTADGDVVAPRNKLHRGFKERHISMIAVGGAIGTGLIIGTGQGLVRGGPASLLIAYCIVGLLVFFVMTAMGEMATAFPMDKGFGGYATRFVDPALG